MRARGSAESPNDAWTAAVYATDREAALGAAVVIDERRVLTCRHVVEDTVRRGAGVLVRFPKAGLDRGVVRPVRQVRHGKEDVAVLELAENVPPEVTPAVLRSPQPADLVGDRWWAFGFPRDTELGTDAYGVVGTTLAWGWIRLDTRSRYVVKPGFSGAGLWSTDFRAVVGLVGRARSGGENPGDAQALTMYQIVKDLPDENLAALAAWSLEAAGQPALDAWGWSLDTDEESRRHWRPRARGVSRDSEHGYRFRGRTEALSVIVGWLERPVPDRRVLVVTGFPGVGKSAVLGRVVTTADAGVRAALPAEDRNVKAPVGSVACAVHAKGKTALDVAAEIARAASVRMPTAVDDLPPALARALKQRPGRRFNLVVDALDEAASPTQARLMISGLLRPIAQTCGPSGAQVVVGTRRKDDGGDLIGAFGMGLRIVDLDRAEFFAEPDLAEYALATLAMAGDPRPGNPYADPQVARPLAGRIAALADRNFLIAGLIARTHGMYDTEPADPRTLMFTATVDAALAEYVARLPPVGQVPAATVLTALAYAQAPGLSVDLWQVALGSLGARVVQSDLARFVGSSAANFLVESSDIGDARQYRLFHQALDDALLRARDQDRHRESDVRAIARDLIAFGRRRGWAAADPYLLRSLPNYAYRAGAIDALLNDESYLLYGDLPRLAQFASHARTPAGRARARLLYLTPQAIGAPSAERAALFSVTAELDRLGHAYATWRGMPYRARWAAATGRVERAVFEGHAGIVRAMCPVEVEGKVLLATASDDWTVWLWDPVTGRHEMTLAGHRAAVLAVCTVQVGARVVLVTGGRDGAILVWDPATGQRLGRLIDQGAAVRALCPVQIGGRTGLASGGDDTTIRTWDIRSGQQLRTLSGHTDSVSALAAFRMGTRVLLASGGHDHTTRFWEPRTGEMLGTKTNIDRVRAICPMDVQGQALLAITSYRSVQLWNPATGRVVRTLDGPEHAIRGLAPVCSGGRQLLAAGGHDNEVRLWDPATGDTVRRLTGHTDAVSALCPVTVGEETLLASASHDRTARVWDLAVERSRHVQAGRSGRVDAACAVAAGPRTLVATAEADDRVLRLWDPVTGVAESTLEENTFIRTMCAVDDGDRQLVATASGTGAIVLWDPQTGGRERMRIRREGSVRAICAVYLANRRAALATAGSGRSVVRLWTVPSGRQVRRGVVAQLFHSGAWRRAHARGINAVQSLRADGVPLLATAGDDGMIALWELNGRRRRTLVGHQGAVRTLCVTEADGRSFLVSAGDDQTLRMWNPQTGAGTAVLTGHTHRINAVCPVTVDRRPMVASVSDDRTVKLWDPVSRSSVLSIPVHHPALTCVQTSGVLIVGLTAGVLAIDLSPAASELAYFKDVRSG